jgi:hypothetical protein
MNRPHWTQSRRWGPRGANPNKPRRKRLADMTPEQRAAHELRVVQNRARKVEALASMTPELLAEYDAARAVRRAALKSLAARRRAPAQAAVAAWVVALHVPGDLPLADREPPVPQSEATLRGIVLADFERANGARALVMLREWDGRLRILFTLAYVENGRAVRSRGWTLDLFDLGPDGEVVFSTRKLDELIRVLTDVRTRLASGDASLAAQVAGMREARERWSRENAPSATDKVSGENTQ